MIETVAEDRAKAFSAALGDLPTESSSRNNGGARLGLVLAVVGILVTVIGTLMSQATNNPLNQSTALSLGLVGLALVVLGAALFLRYSFGQFLRFWMVRLSYELSRNDRGSED